MTARKVHFISLAAILLASAYPIYMGVFMLAAQIRDGGVDVTAYPKYVIPYTPISAALIACAALLPLAYKYCKKFALPVLSVLGILLFLAVETGFERMTVFDTVYEQVDVTAAAAEASIIEEATEVPVDVGAWQYYLCAVLPPMPPDEMEPMPPDEIESAQPGEPEQITTANPLLADYSPVFKLHFYMISIIMIISVLGTAYGFYRMYREQSFKRKKPLIAQLVLVAAFIGLCVLACFTAFFRNGEQIISPISAVLMTLFFLVFGVTAGIYAGTWLYGKRKLFSMLLPSLGAVLVTLLMYFGELVMMRGGLYQLGKGFFFEPFASTPFAIADMLVMLSSGLLTYGVLYALRSKEHYRR